MKQFHSDHTSLNYCSFIHIILKPFAKRHLHVNQGELQNVAIANPLVCIED